MPDPKLILASISPRRKELLAHLTTEFEIVPSTVDEPALLDANSQLSPVEIVTLLALAKARNVASNNSGAVVIGADTIVVIDGEILGKPTDAFDAETMLLRLSGRQHTVYTSIAVVQDTFAESQTVATEVKFKELSIETIEKYIATGEPMDKAGSYGIQNAHITPVASIVGDYYNVMGLPLTELAGLLTRYFGTINAPPDQPAL